MVLHRVKAICLALSCCLCVACSNDFKTNTDKHYTFSFNGFQNSLKINNENKNFILAFFSKDCGVCKVQIPILKEFAKNYSNDIFIVLNDALNKNDANNYALKYKLNFEIFYEKNAADFLSKSVNGVYGVPVIAVFENAKLKEKFIGLVSLARLENL